MNIKKLKAKITKDWGKKCRTFSPLCAVCQIWHAYAIFEDLYELKGHIKGIKK